MLRRVTAGIRDDAIRAAFKVKRFMLLRKEHGLPESSIQFVGLQVTFTRGFVPQKSVLENYAPLYNGFYIYTQQSMNITSNRICSRFTFSPKYGALSTLFKQYINTQLQSPCNDHRAIFCGLAIIICKRRILTCPYC